MLTAAVFTAAPHWKPPRYPPAAEWTPAQWAILRGSAFLGVEGSLPANQHLATLGHVFDCHGKGGAGI